MSSSARAEARRVAAVVLAAGGSRRLGAPKQLVAYGGRSLVRRAVEAACGAACASVFVVVGAAREGVLAEIAGTRASAVENPEWEAGLSSSIAAGVCAADADRPDAFLLLPADQPHVSPEVLDRLIGAWDGSETGIAACRYAGTAGVPALFGRAHRDALTRLSGDRGARGLLAGAVLVEWPEGAVDVDTPEDVARLEAPPDRYWK